MNIRVQNNSLCKGYKEAETNCGEWEEHITNYVRGVRVARNNEFYDISVPDGLFKIGQECFLVYVEYSSGDSFGNSEGNIEYVGLFSTEEFARDCVDKIKKHYKEYEERSWPYKTNTEIPTWDNREIKMYPPWCGYFESIESVEVFKTILK